MKVAICDDSIEWAEKIKNYLEKNCDKLGARRGNLQFVLYDDWKEILKNYGNENFDIVFMDIEFGEVIGFDIAKKIMERNPEFAVVYITNYEHYVMKSFVCRPLGFVRKKHMETDMITVFDEIKRNLGKKEKTIIFKNGKNDVSLSADKIIAIEVYGHKMILILKTRTIEIKDSISRVEEELTRYHFIKISRNRMINFKYVKEIEKNKIILADEYEFCVSKNRLKYVEEEWLKYKCFY